MDAKVEAVLDEYDERILDASITNAALELLPETLASLAILPLQVRLVYRIGEAYGYELDDRTGRTTVLVHDSNTPDREVQLTSDAGQPDWTASNGRTWRGFFVQDYTPRSPRVATRTLPGRRPRPRRR